MSSPRDEPVILPLYRSTDTVRAAEIVGVGEGQVQIDFERFGDDYPILKPVMGTPSVGDFYVETSMGAIAIPKQEFYRKYKHAKSDAPESPGGMVDGMARVGYEAARASQPSFGPAWKQADDFVRHAATLCARALLKDPNIISADIYDIWSSTVSAGKGEQVSAPSTVNAISKWSQVSVPVKTCFAIFRATICAM